MQKYDISNISINKIIIKAHGDITVPAYITPRKSKQDAQLLTPEKASTPKKLIFEVY